MFFPLGYRRCSLFASLALIPTLGLCQWSGSDSQNLERIKDNIINLSNGQTSIDAHVANIGYDTADILLVIQNINRSVGRVTTSQGEYTITKGLYDIQQIAESLDKTLSISGQSGYQNTHDTQVYSRLQDIRQDMGTGFQSVVSAISGLGAITNSINALARHIDNVTNYMCYSPSYANSFTNLAPIMDAFYLNTEDFEEEALYFLHQYLGRVPTTDELDRAKELLYNYGRPGLFYAQVLSRLGMYTFESPSWHTAYLRLFDYINGFNNESDISYAGQMYYYQYQTRDLTDMTSNMLTRINGNFSNIVTSISAINNITNRFVTGTVIDSDLEDNTLYDDEGAASNTTTSFLGKVAHNFVGTFGLSGNPLETNDVEAIDSDDLSGYRREIQSNEKGEEIESAVHQVNSQLTAFASDLESFSDVSGAFVLPGTTIDGVEIPDITFSTGTAPNFAALRFVFSVIKTVVTIGFVLAAVTQLMRDNQSNLNALRW